jgi:outer membrane protein assembly factor BamB
MEDGRPHDVVYVSTMANSVWAFDANDGALLWKVVLGFPSPKGEGSPVS